MVITWFGWIWLIMTIFGAAATVLTVDQPREPLSPGVALFVLLYTAFSIWGMFNVGVVIR